MTDILLYLFFVICPFFRIFQEALLQNIHNILGILGIGTVIFGLIFNKLDEYLGKFIRILIPVLISVIAVHFFLKTYDSAQIKITLLELGGPLVLILWLIKRINLGNFKIAQSRKYVLYPALFFILSAILSFILSPFKLETFEPGILRRISYLGVFLVTVFEFDREDFIRVLKWVGITLFIVVSYGLIQLSGYDWHIWKGAFGTNIFSTFGNPNFYAAWLILVYPLLFAKIMLSREPAKRLGYVIFCFTTFYCLFRTNTKGSWVGLGVEITVFVILATLYLLKGNPRVLKRTALVIVIATVAVIITGVTWFSMKRITSIRFRLFTWGATMKMISEPIFARPAKALIFGHGIETFKLVYPAYRRPEIFYIEGKHNTETDHAHNEYMEILYDEGIIGLTVLFWLLVNIYHAAFKRLSMIGVGVRKSDDEYYFVALIAGTLGMLAHAGVSVHVRFVSSGFILWTFLGFVVAHTAPVPRRKQEPFKELITLPKFAAILLLLTISGFNSYYASCRFRANIFHNKAIAYSKQRMWDQALEFYGKVQKNHPSFIMAYYFVGNVYNDKLSEAIQAKNQQQVKVNYDKAVESYNKVLSMYPNYVQVHFQLGMLHLKVGNVDKAKVSFKKYLNIVDPVYPYTYYRLGMISAREGDLDTARWYLEEATRRINPTSTDLLVEAYTNLANFYIMQNKNDKAEKTYKEILEIKNDNIPMLGALANLYEKLKDNGRAAEMYKKILELQPGNNTIIQKIKSLE